jgi:MtrB/PioB family decaheme-associated outer membrane protein
MGEHDMKTNQNLFSVRISVLAVQGALMTMAILGSATARAVEDVSVADLAQPTSMIEIGATYVSPTNSDNRSNVVRNTNGDKTSYKFGEYNGLQKEGFTADANFDIRGGGGYNSDDTLRWNVKGTNLGRETRNLSAEYGKQGSFRINLGYDELLRNRSDTYMTPYQGAGGNNFTLPSNWITPVVPQNSASQNFRALDPTNGTANATVAGVNTAPSAGNLTTLANIRNADLPDFHNVNLYTKRTSANGGFSYQIDPQWDVNVSFKREKKDGYKPMSLVTSQVAEYAATLADPINQTTDQYNASLNYRGEKAFLSIDYYGSIFKNDINSVTFNDTSNLTKTATYAGAPSNQFHQFGLTGGYNFTSTTKLVMNGSYSRNTQNEAFVTAGQNGQFPLGLPTDSLHGLVVTKDFGLKLTAKPVKDLSLAAHYKYNDRDNQTPINTYYFHDANEANSGTFAFGSIGGLTTAQLGSNLNVYNNRPYSKKVNQFGLDADYKVAKGQTIKVGYDWQQIDRTCDTWYNCADAPTTKEDTLRAEWRGKLAETVQAKAGYEYSKRKVNYDENAFLSLVPMANVTPTTGAGAGATMSAYQYLLATGLTGFGPVAGNATNVGNALIFSPNNNIIPQALYGSRNNINELIGMRRFNMADRNRDKLKLGVNWDATEKLSFSAGYNYSNDDYTNSVYGLKSGKNGALNLDGTYAANDNFSVTAYYTLEDQRSKSAGDAYGSNSAGTGAANGSGSTGAFATNAANTNISGGVCYTTAATEHQNAKTDPCLNWSADMHDSVNTLGLSFKKMGLMSGKLEMTGDLAFSWAKTDINVSGGSYIINPLAAAGAQPGGVGWYYIAASALPTITTNTIALKLAGKYKIDKSAAVRVDYGYTRMKATDWAYDGMQFGSGTNYLPTNEQAPNFKVQTVSAVYIYSFK